MKAHTFLWGGKMTSISYICIVVTAMHGGCNFYAVQVRYFIRKDNDLSGHKIVRCQEMDSK